MKGLAWILTFAALAALPLALLAQSGGPRSSSVIRPVGFGHGHGHHGHHGGPGCDCGPAPLSCSGNCCQGYDCCCPHHCCLLDCFKKIVRSLDCLLPCHSCGSKGCGGGCGHAHFFHKGCCDTCNVGCTTVCPTCAAPGGAPMLTDPFQDDPTPPAPPRLSAPPVPMPDSRDAHYQRSLQTPYATRGVAAASSSRRMVVSPYKLSSNQPAVRPYEQPQRLSPSMRRTPPMLTQERMAGQSGIKVAPAEHSVLRRASVEEDFAEYFAEGEVAVADDAPQPPALLPTVQKAGKSKSDIPANPLRN